MRSLLQFLSTVRHISLLGLSILALQAGNAFAQSLPQVENIRVDGDTLAWDAVDVAAGYNIYRDHSYFDTVRGVLEYTLSEPGTYGVVAFDGSGSFGPTPRGDDTAEYAPGDGTAAAETINSFTVTIQKTCRNVAPGGSCIASCPRSVERPNGGTVSLAYLSGGACATSDIVEADAFVSDRTYKCTVPTFSGEVTAQAVCVRF